MKDIHQHKTDLVNDLIDISVDELGCYHVHYDGASMTIPFHSGKLLKCGPLGLTVEALLCILIDHVSSSAKCIEHAKVIDNLNQCLAVLKDKKVRSA